MILNKMRVFFAAMSLFVFAGLVHAQTTDMAPNKLIESVSAELLDLLKNDQDLRAGDADRVMDVVNEKLLPHLNFRRMTAMAIGPKWREATEAQKDQVEHEFQMMLIRTYSGALDQVSQDVNIVMLPFRAAADDKDVLVRSEVRIGGNPTPIELSYRLRLEATGWMVYNVNVAGVWMVENYRSQFQPILNSSGIDGLIKGLQERNVGGNDKVN